MRVRASILEGVNRQRGLPEVLPPAMRGLRDEALARFDCDAVAVLPPK